MPKRREPQEREGKLKSKERDKPKSAVMLTPEEAPIMIPTNYHIKKELEAVALTPDEVQTLLLGTLSPEQRQKVHLAIEKKKLELARKEEAEAKRRRDMGIPDPDRFVDDPHIFHEKPTGVLGDLPRNENDPPEDGEPLPDGETPPVNGEDPAAAPQLDAEPEPEPEPEPETFEFDLDYTEDGVYLVLGKNATASTEHITQIMQFVRQKDVQDVDRRMLFSALLKGGGGGRTRIAPPQFEIVIDESYTVDVSQDGLSATITVSAPDKKGARLSFVKVLKELGEVYGLHYGIKREVLFDTIRTPQYGVPVLVAEGVAPVPGTNGCLIWHINRDIETSDDAQPGGLDSLNAAKTQEGTHLFETVEEGQVLVERVLPQDGSPGRSVHDTIIPAERGKNFNLPKGKNTRISTDGLQLIAAKPGRVDIVNNTVVVLSTFILNSNVDARSGDIDFDGDVFINGNVTSGFKIQASGNIEVSGVVEAARLESDRDIIIRGGIQGGGEGIVTAKGDIYAQYVQYATVQCSGRFNSASVLHSNVVAFGIVDVTAGVGAIIGGNVSAGSMIVARSIGNKSSVVTNVEVGAARLYNSRILDLQRQTQSIEAEIQKYYPLINQPPQPDTSPDYLPTKMKATRQLLAQKTLLEQYKSEYAAVEEMQKRANRGQIHVLGTVYPRVQIDISNQHYTNVTEMNHVTFQLLRDEIEHSYCFYTES